MPPELIALLLQAAAQTGTGVYQQLKANSLAKHNPRPNYDIPMEYYKSLNQAENQASYGYSPQALSAYYGQAGQAQAGSISAILQSGGDPNQINSVYGDTLQNQRQILGDDAQAKDQHIANLINEYHVMGDQQDKKWQINKYQPYLAKAGLIAQDKQAGFANIFGGIDTASTGFAANETSKLADAYMKMMNGGGTPTEQKQSSSYYGGAGSLPPSPDMGTQNPYTPISNTPTYEPTQPYNPYEDLTNQNSWQNYQYGWGQ